MEEGKKTRGRQRIPMQRIEKASDRFATFSKRRKGLYKKATELCWLSGCDIGIVLTSPTGKMFSFFNPSPETIIRKLFGRTQNVGGEISQAVDEHARRRVNELYEMMDSVEARIEVLSQKSKALDQMSIPSNTWWETPVADFSLEDVERCQAFLVGLQNEASACFGALNNGGGGSSVSIAAQEQNAAVFSPLLPSNAPIL